MFFGKRELKFPAQASNSVSDNLRRQKQEMSGSGIGSVEIFADWGDILKARPFDLPFYTAVNDRACIAILFSQNNLPRHETIGRVLGSPIPLKLHTSAFLDGNYPLLRCNFIFPDNPASPLTLETPLNLREGDVQDFCRAVLADETIDIVMKHELTDGTYSAAFKVPGLAEILKKELGKIFGKLNPDIPRAMFFESVKRMESAFSSPTAGISPKKTAVLVLVGEAKNAIIRT
ncbi:MAG: hypothetical protein F9K46_00835 [Anaerolineae bacterium]|nr:MAG: hypothetical protein F9K46_00835 [Anaerolineae bacterium]